MAVRDVSEVRGYFGDCETPDVDVWEFDTLSLGSQVTPLLTLEMLRRFHLMQQFQLEEHAVSR